MQYIKKIFNLTDRHLNFIRSKAEEYQLTEVEVLRRILDKHMEECSEKENSKK